MENVSQPTAVMKINEIPKFGTVYRLSIGDYYYVGSTFESLHWRINHHISTSKRTDRKCSERKIYKHIAENGGWDAVVVSVLEREIPENKVLEREQFYINLTDPLCLNTINAFLTVVPARTPKYDGGEKRQTYYKGYYEANKEAIKEKRRARWLKDKADPEKYDKIKETVKNASKRYREKTNPACGESQA